MAYRRHFSFQYRLVWHYKGEKSARHFVSDRAFAVLQLMRRIGTKTPWVGYSEGRMKGVWTYLARRQHVPFEAVAEMSLKQAALALQASFPALIYIRVEMRQVAEWTTVIDPMRSLTTVYTARTMKRLAKALARVEGMTRDELDTWRWTAEPTEHFGRG